MNDYVSELYLSSSATLELLISIDETLDTGCYGSYFEDQIVVIIITQLSQLSDLYRHFRRFLSSTSLPSPF